MMTTTKTGTRPRLAIGFSADKRGRKFAYYVMFSAICCTRKVRMSLVEAEMLVATGEADEVIQEVAGNERV